MSTEPVHSIADLRKGVSSAHAGANSIFNGDKLLATGTPAVAADRALFDRLALRAAGDPA